jgi:uncharacterized SAM-binding protein YcdF (DUF218 family)
VYPAKLNEYLALGKPVVATDLSEIREFNAVHPEAVYTAADGGGFVAQIERALAEDGPERQAARVRIASQNSWTERVAQMSLLIEERAKLNWTERTASWRETFLRLARRARVRVVGAASAATLGYLLVFHTPLVWYAAEPLRLADPPRPADVIVVLAGGVGESGKAGEGYQERVQRAVELYRAGLAARMVFSSGYAYTFREPEVMKALAVALGVPPAAILLEERAANTRENATNVAAILRERGWGSLLLVSSPYHMRRARMTFRRVAPDLAVTLAPVVHSAFYAHEGGATAEQIGGILHEYLAILVYRLRGWA